MEDCWRTITMYIQIIANLRLHSIMRVVIKYMIIDDLLLPHLTSSFKIENALEEKFELLAGRISSQN